MFTFPVGFFGGTGDPYWDNVVLYLPLTGTNGQTTFIDISQYRRTVTRNGNTVISTAQFPPLIGVNSSAYFDGAGDYLGLSSSPTLSMGTSDFTLEVWVYMPVLLAAAFVGAVSYNGSLGIRWVPSSNRLLVDSSGVASTPPVAWTPPISTWYYLACVRSGDTFSWYADGVLLGQVTASFNFSGETRAIGGNPVSNTLFLSGYLSNLRLTKGIVRDVSVVPTAPFPTY